MEDKKGKNHTFKKNYKAKTHHRHFSSRINEIGKTDVSNILALSSQKLIKAQQPDVGPATSVRQNQ